MSRAKPRSRKYHHGDLKPALIAAGLRIVERQGIERLTLRAVAQAVRVSRSAPYHHFANKAELTAAVAAAGFAHMLDAIAQLAQCNRAVEPIDRLTAIGQGYIRFARTHPSIFRLMFRPELTQPAAHAVLMEAEARAIGTLLETIISCQKAGQLPAGDPRRLAAFCWSNVHGLSMLHIDEVLKETPLGQISFDRLAEDATNTSIIGLRHREW